MEYIEIEVPCLTRAIELQHKYGAAHNLCCSSSTPHQAREQKSRVNRPSSPGDLPLLHHGPRDVSLAAPLPRSRGVNRRRTRHTKYKEDQQECICTCGMYSAAANERRLKQVLITWAPHDPAYNQIDESQVWNGKAALPCQCFFEVAIFGLAFTTLCVPWSSPTVPSQTGEETRGTPSWLNDYCTKRQM